MYNTKVIYMVFIRRNGGNIMSYAGAKKQVGTSLQKDMFDKLVWLAKKRKVSIAVIVRGAIEDLFEEESRKGGKKSCTQQSKD